jgi:hypothetical protein
MQPCFDFHCKDGTRKPCKIQMDEFVHEYFSIDRYRKTYASKFNPMTSKDQWLHVDLGFKIKKPKLRRKPGRLRKSWIKPFDEVG